MCPENKESAENMSLPVNHSSQEHCRKSRASIKKSKAGIFLNFFSLVLGVFVRMITENAEIAEGWGVMHSLKETAARSDFLW